MADAALDGLTRGGNFESLRFTGGSLDGETVPAGTTFSNVTFEDVTLRGCELEALEFRQSTFLRCRFDSSAFRESTFARCVFFDKGSESGCSLRFTNLRLARFEDCDLSMCRLDRARLHQIYIARSQGQGLSAREATAVHEIVGGFELAEGSLVDCNLAYADFTGADLTRCELSGNRLSHAVFDRAILREAQLTDCELHGVSAEGVEIRGADLRGSELSGLDVREVDLDGVRITVSQQSALLEPLGLIVTDDRKDANRRGQATVRASPRSVRPRK